GRPGVDRAERGEVAQALGARQQARVGDSVAGARQEVGKAEGLAQRARQDREREVEAPADPPQQVTDEVGHSLSNGRRGGCGESLAFLRLSWHLRSSSLPLSASAARAWRNRSARSAALTTSAPNAVASCATVRHRCG